MQASAMFSECESSSREDGHLRSPLLLVQEKRHIIASGRGTTGHTTTWILLNSDQARIPDFNAKDEAKLEKKKLKIFWYRFKHESQETGTQKERYTQGNYMFL